MTSTPPRPPRISLEFGGSLHTPPMCVSPLPRLPVPETWWNTAKCLDTCLIKDSKVDNQYK